MRRQYFIGIFFVLLLLILVPFSGCTKTKSAFKKILPESMTNKKKPANPELKKRVMVLPFVDLAGLDPAMEKKIMDDLLAVLSTSPDLIICEAPDDVNLPAKDKLCTLGIVKPENEFLEKAEDLGMNAIITGVVNPVRSAKRKTGILFLSKSKKMYEISVVINVFDIMTKTLLINNLESEEELVSLDKIPDAQDEKRIMNELLKKYLSDILERQAKAVTKELSKDPWTGKILSVEKDTIKTTAGKDIGLRPNQHFTVFARGETISSEGGQSYSLLGDRIGEIRVTSIMESQSLAVPVGQGSFSPGQVIRMTR